VAVATPKQKYLTYFNKDNKYGKYVTTKKYTHCR
jgi:hypothetical protein